MNIIMIAGTNLELYLFSSIACLLKEEEKSFQCKLLLPHVFAKSITPEIRGLYSEIELFEIPSLTPPVSKNPLRMLQNIFDNFRQCLTYRSYIKQTISDADVVCISGFREFFANVMCRQAPKRSRLVALRPANQKVEETAPFVRRPLLSFILNIKNFLFGYSVMDYKWMKGVANRLLAKNYVKYPYHRTILITDHDVGKQDSWYRLPPPFISLQRLYKKEEQEPAILIAGEGTFSYQLLYKKWEDSDQKIYDEFLDYVRNNFQNYKLYFKPKKGQDQDTGRHNLAGIRLLESDLSFEEICLKKNIQKVISIKSMASKVASCFGISSYFLYPLFNLPEEKRKIIEGEHDDIRSIVKVKQLSDLKKEAGSVSNTYDFHALAGLYWKAIAG